MVGWQGSSRLISSHFVILRKCDGERKSALRDLQGNSAFLNPILSHFRPIMSSSFCFSLSSSLESQNRDARYPGMAEAKGRTIDGGDAKLVCFGPFRENC